MSINRNHRTPGTIVPDLIGLGSSSGAAAVPTVTPASVIAETATSGRQLTDESLRAERQTTDGAVGELRVQEESADRVMDLARVRADAVLAHAREKADQRQPNASVTQDRVDADKIVRDERATADENLRSEREENIRTLMSLLPFERESTNRNLLTERARSDAALLNRDDFLGMVSHDLNNLLAGIVLVADDLAFRASDCEEGRRAIKAEKRIQLYSARMKRLIADLSDVTSIEAGKLAVVKVPCDLRSLLAETVETFRLLAAEKGISLHLDVTFQSLLVPVDHGRIFQVLANLVANAIKFTPQGGKVVLQAQRTANEVCVSVSDTGAGIPEGLLEAVFERFWQAGMNDRRGLGLGLYIARNIIAAHGGRIWAESQTGQGTTFKVTLPIALLTLGDGSAQAPSSYKIVH